MAWKQDLESARTALDFLDATLVGEFEEKKRMETALDEVKQVLALPREEVEALDLTYRVVLDVRELRCGFYEKERILIETARERDSFKELVENNEGRIEKIVNSALASKLEWAEQKNGVLRELARRAINCLPNGSSRLELLGELEEASK